MVNRIDSDSREVLSYRPNITFIEPDQEPGTITGKTYLQSEDVKTGRDRIKKLANAVNQLATALQARVDQRAANVVIRLDRKIDQDAIQAMRRRFPGEDPTVITYDQYRQCRNGVIDKGIKIGDQAILSADRIRNARDILRETGTFNPGQFGTDASLDGSLRPELDSDAQIIEPIDIEEVQINLICILVNFIWSNFIKPALVAAGGIFGPIIEGLPDEICDPGADIELPGLLVLGQKPDDLLTGKASTEAAINVGLD